MKNIGGKVVGLFLAAIAGLVINYLALPARNLHSEGAWIFWILLIGIYVVCDWIGNFICDDCEFDNSRLVGIVPFVLLILAFIVLGVGSGSMFQSSRLASLITVQDAVFEEDIEETTSIKDIALMDTASAAIIGNRTMGTLEKYVSQFIIGNTYSTISYNGKPMKVAPLEYNGLFKYNNNKINGIPGYILVDPISGNSEFVELEEGIKYSSSAYFANDLRRAIRNRFPSEIFTNAWFEIDEDGNPYWVIPTLKANAGLFGGKDVESVIIMDAVSGDCEKYAVEEVPEWVDIVYDGDLVCKKYDWYGTLKNGFWNSILSQTGCKATTDDYGYKVIGNDVYIFTGVTSVAADESNIGFILTNGRTGEYKYYSVPGAEEYSAMAAAEGMVQEKDYTASFPSLVNIDGQPTYILVLKDKGGLVKMYSMINVEHYSIVVTGTTQNECLQAYRKAMAASNEVDAVVSDDIKNKTFVVSEVLFVNVEGETVVYIKGENIVAKSLFNEDLVLIDEGDSVTVEYYEDNDIIEANSVILK